MWNIYIFLNIQPFTYFYKYLINESRETYLGNLILFTSFLLAQTSAQPSVQTYYPQVYAEQQLVGKEMTAEKSLLSPKIQLDTELNRVQSDPVLRYATWGFAVYDPQTNKMITCYNENVPLVPASTTKLLTTDTAYSLFGKNSSG